MHPLYKAQGQPPQGETSLNGTAAGASFAIVQRLVSLFCGQRAKFDLDPARAPHAARFPQLSIRAGSAEHLDRAVERHEPGLDRETGLALADLVAEFGEHFAVGLGFDLRIGDARRPKAISAAPQSR